MTQKAHAIIIKRCEIQSGQWNSRTYTELRAYTQSASKCIFRILLLAVDLAVSQAMKALSLMSSSSLKASTTACLERSSSHMANAIGRTKSLSVAHRVGAFGWTPYI